MKLLLLLTLCIYSVGCSPRLVENPAVEARTFTEEEFDSDIERILNAEEGKKEGLSLRSRFTSIIDNHPNYEVKIPEKITSEGQIQMYQQAIQNELNSIESFLNKYRGNFRIRYKNGDLMVKTLTDDAYLRIDLIKNAWLAAQQKVSAANPLTDT